jgi:hypothetical protein
MKNGDSFNRVIFCSCRNFALGSEWLKITAHPHRGRAGINKVKKDLKNLRSLTRNPWYRNELIQAFRSGPGAVSLYFSVLIGLLCSFLSFLFMSEMEIPSLGVSLAMVFLSLNFIINDLRSYLRNHGLLLVRRAAQRCEDRMKRLGVEASSVFAFLHWLYADPGIERVFRVEPNEFIETAVRALGRLTETAIRYGSRGKYVFEINQEPFMIIEVLLRSDEKELLSGELSPELKKSLEEVPYYDPEGWSLTYRAGSLNTRDSS